MLPLQEYWKWTSCRLEYSSYYQHASVFVGVLGVMDIFSSGLLCNGLTFSLALCFTPLTFFFHGSFLHCCYCWSLLLQLSILPQPGFWSGTSRHHCTGHCMYNLDNGFCVGCLSVSVVESWLPSVFSKSRATSIISGLALFLNTHGWVGSWTEHYELPWVHRSLDLFKFPIYHWEKEVNGMELNAADIHCTYSVEEAFPCFCFAEHSRCYLQSLWPPLATLPNLLQRSRFYEYLKPCLVPWALCLLPCPLYPQLSLWW